ncbi:MAG: glycosyltransferase [Chloroflexota bacterium]
MNSPTVSILLPVRNEEKNIQELIASILSQDYPDEMDILVVDGMSTDKTREIIAGIKGQHAGINLRILDNPGKIVPTGMNVALREAQGGYIVRIDGHTIIAQNYVRNCVELLRSRGAENVGGRMNAVGF